MLSKGLDKFVNSLIDIKNICLKMLHNNMYYDIDNGSIDMAASPTDVSNNTPFLVKNILNLVNQNDGYEGCHVDG